MPIKILFRYAYPLDRERRKLYEDRKLGPYPSPETVRERLEAIRAGWELLNAQDRVVRRLQDLTGVELTRDLEFCIFGAGMSAMSKPLVMPVMRRDGALATDDQCMETVIHELCHRYAGDAEETPRLAAYWSHVNEAYASETVSARNHVIVYALMRIVMAELYGQERVAEFLRPMDPEYRRAVEIVGERGAEDLVQEFRERTKSA